CGRTPTPVCGCRVRRDREHRCVRILRNRCTSLTRAASCPEIGWTIGMTTPGLDPDPYEADVPDAVWSLWAHEVAAWHTPEWWHRHWELSGLLDGIDSGWLPDGRENWIR